MVGGGEAAEVVELVPVLLGTSEEESWVGREPQQRPLLTYLLPDGVEWLLNSGWPGRRGGSSRHFESVRT